MRKNSNCGTMTNTTMMIMITFMLLKLISLFPQQVHCFMMIPLTVTKTSLMIPNNRPQTTSKVSLYKGEKHRSYSRSRSSGSGNVGLYSYQHPFDSQTTNTQRYSYQNNEGYNSGGCGDESGARGNRCVLNRGYDEASSPPKPQCTDIDLSSSSSRIKSVNRRRLMFSMLASASTLGAVTTFTSSSSQSTAAAIVATTAVAASAALNILKPPLDDRTYEAYELENGLRVLLCSDPESTSAAAAMDVHVGACSDPPEVPGLAHFTEHMLFLGTEKYPREGGFESFLSSNGGMSNAYTDSEDTVYYFTMENGQGNVNEALQRFGSFFSSPLFTESATTRELNAIDSENAKNLQSDVFRIYQIEKSRMNRSHPFSKFFTGNRSTLLDGTRKQGLDLRNELLKFYGKYYSANQMALAIVAPQSISLLKEYVSQAFSDIPNSGRGKPEANWSGIAPFSSSTVRKTSDIPGLGYMVEVVPVQDLRQVTLTWPIEFTSTDDRDVALLIKPDYYISHLLGHEGPGSLLSYLKDQGWANSLASASNEELSDFYTFVVTVELTNKGLQAIDDVCEVVFTYVKMLQEEEIPDYIFDEVLQLSDLDWRFTTKGDPGSYVQSLVSSMQKYDPTLYIAGPRRIALRDAKSKLLNTASPRSSFSSDMERSLTRNMAVNLASKLTVENVMLTVLSKNFKKIDQNEKWYGTGYNAKPILSSTLLKWANNSRADSLGILYPRPNVFIPTENGLKLKKGVKKVEYQPRSFEERMKPITPPKMIRNDGHTGRWTVYYKKDDRFGQPKAFVILELMTSRVYSSVTNAALALLYQTCATDSLDEYTYDAKLAGLIYDVQVVPRGVRLTFGGYNDKLQEFAGYVARKLARNVNQVLPRTQEEFLRYKDRLIRGLAAFDVKQPYSHAIYYTSIIFQPRNFIYPNSDIRTAMESATLEELTKYANTLWSSGKGEALVQGNVDEEEALKLVDTIDDALGFQTISSVDEYPARIKALPLPITRRSKLRLSEPNPENKNSATQLSIQCLGRTERDHVLMEILNAILKEPFYDELRTKQQLGYIVSSGLKGYEETRNLSLIVQSSVAPAKKITAAIERFVDGFRSSYLEALNEGDISNFVRGLLDTKLEPDKALSTEVTRNWSEITSGRLQFDRIQREASALLEITKQDVLNFWDEIVVADDNDGGGRRALVTEVIPREGLASSQAPLRTTGYGNSGGSSSKRNGELLLGIDDIELFRKDREILVNIWLDPVIPASQQDPVT